MTSLTCPACKDQPVEEIFDRDVPFLGCTACFGLFVTPDNLAAYVERASGERKIVESYRELLAAAGDGTKTQGKRACPRCGQGMVRIGFGDSPFVVLDRCAEHGLWLDRKELKRVIRAARGHAAAQGHVFTSVDDDDD